MKGCYLGEEYSLGKTFTKWKHKIISILCIVGRCLFIVLYICKLYIMYNVLSHWLILRAHMGVKCFSIKNLRTYKRKTLNIITMD